MQKIGGTAKPGLLPGGLVLLHHVHLPLACTPERR